MPTMAYTPLSKLAAPSAVGAAVLVVTAQLLMLPFDPKDHVATTQEPLFRIGGVLYMAGFCLLLVALVGAWEWLAASSGAFGTVAVVVALIGTLMMGGDLWFETFAVPWLSDQAPEALDTDPTPLLALGAISSYISFAAGWALFGLAALRARAFPMPICLVIIVGGLAGFQALLAPWAIPLALGVGALGIWMLRSSPPATAEPDPAVAAAPAP